MLSLEQNLLVTPPDFSDFFMARRGQHQGNKFKAVGMSGKACFDRLWVLNSRAAHTWMK